MTRIKKKKKKNPYPNFAGIVSFLLPPTLMPKTKRNFLMINETFTILKIHKEIIKLYQKKIDKQ